jgi:DNA-binding NarL/FixJ family response regulator
MGGARQGRRERSYPVDTGATENAASRRPARPGGIAPVSPSPPGYTRPNTTRGDMTQQLESTEPRHDALRVVIVDDHDLFRTGLRNLLEEQGIQVVGEAAAGSDAIRSVRELAPDVVVMDLNMPGMTGVEATRQITGIAPLTRVLVLTISDQDSDVLDAILAGACGYQLKDSSIQDLMTGIRAASIGESLISPNIASKVLQRVRSTSSVPAIAETIRAELSDREIEVLKLIANGKDNAMIAADLHISPKTVKNHISNILMKLQIENRIQAAVYAVRSGLV